MGLAAAGIAFFPALAIGSFLNVVAARVPLKRSVVSPPLGLHELRHRARLARQRPGPLVARPARPLPHVPDARISWRYPAVELVDGAARRRLLLEVRPHRPRPRSPPSSARRSSSLSAIDIERRIVPNRIVLPAAADRPRRADGGPPEPRVARSAASAPRGFLFLAALAYPARDGHGRREARSAARRRCSAGPSRSPSSLGMIAALVPSVVLFARHGAAARKMAIPFAPFLALGGRRRPVRRAPLLCTPI